MCLGALFGGGEDNTAQIAAQQAAAAQAEAARIKAEQELEKQKADQQAMQDKQNQAAAEASANQKRRYLLQQAALGDGITDEEDTTNPTTRKKTSLLSIVQ